MTMLDVALLVKQGIDFSIRETPKGTLRIAVASGANWRAAEFPINPLPTEEAIQDRIADIIGELHDLAAR